MDEYNIDRLYPIAGKNSELFTKKRFFCTDGQFYVKIVVLEG